MPNGAVQPRPLRRPPAASEEVCPKRQKRQKIPSRKRIDTGACLIEAHPKGVTGVGEHESIEPPKGREALTAAALSLVCSFPAARSSHFSRDSAGEILRCAQDDNGEEVRG